MAPPSGASSPRSAASGSVVGRPAESSAQPGGMSVPSLAWAAIFPRATALVTMSTIAGRGYVGILAASGEVDSKSDTGITAAAGGDLF
jgi:hypothetical protein